MSIILDLIGSWVVRAAMIAIMLTLTINLNDALYQNNSVINDRGQIQIVDSVFYADINMAGYNTPSWASASFKIASTSSVYFYADINNNSLPDSVRYDVVYNSSTRKYKLYRTVNNGSALTLGMAVDSVSFAYYTSGYDGRDSLMLAPSLLKSIKSVAVTLIVNETVTNNKTGQSTQIPIKSFFKITPPNLI